MSFNLTPNRVAKITEMAAAGAGHSDIFKAVTGGRCIWSVVEVAYIARRDANLIPNRVGQFESIEAITATDIRSLHSEAPELRYYAYPIVYGFRPTKANIDRLQNLSKPVSERYSGRGRHSVKAQEKAAKKASANLTATA
jgi:hypothetical protein